MLARRLGKRRIVAETGAGQHGVATATVCARFGSSASSTWARKTCAGRSRTSSAWACSAPRCARVEFGTKTLKEATSEAIRDWITNVETTHYLIGSCVGPAPYPEIVRELQAVIGREAREQLLEAEGRLPEAVVACVGGGSNAIGMFAGFLDDADVRLIGVEAAGAASLGSGRPGVLHGARSSILADEDGQIADAHSISAGLDYPGVGPEHAFLRDIGRAEYVGATDEEALAGVRRPRAHRGDHPGARVGACARACARARRGAHPRRACRGRGDKDLAEVLAAATAAPSGEPCPQDARHLPDGRSRRRRSSPRAAVDGGADIVELGFPFSDPLADGPVIRRAAERALARGMRTRACLDVLAQTRALVGDTPLIPMTYASLLEAYGWERFAEDAATAGATSMIVADLPAGERPETRRVQLVAPTSTDERIALAGSETDGWLYLVTLTGTTGARGELSPALAGLAERARRLVDVPLYAGFGISTPEHARAAAELADGIVVGSRAVQVAEEGRRRCATTSRRCARRSSRSSRPGGAAARAARAAGAPAARRAGEQPATGRWPPARCGSRARPEPRRATKRVAPAQRGRAVPALVKRERGRPSAAQRAARAARGGRQQRRCDWRGNRGCRRCDRKRSRDRCRDRRRRRCNRNRRGRRCRCDGPRDGAANEPAFDLKLVQRHLRLQAQPDGALVAERAAEEAAGDRAEENGEVVGAGRDHAVREQAGNRAQSRLRRSLRRPRT